MSTALGRDVIRAFVERIERLDEEIRATNLDKRDVYAEAKGHGLNVKALKVVIQRRRQDADERSELDQTVELYEEACRSSGTGNATRARARSGDEATSKSASTS